MFRRTFLKILMAASQPPITRLPGRLLAGPAVAPLVLRDLKCESRREPLDVEAASPRLGWKMEALDSHRRSVRQTAYRVIVASSRETLRRNIGDLWDSGVVTTGRSVQIPYEGKKLLSEQTCFWKVQARDELGRWSAWSDPSRWTMGLLRADDWRGVWIGASSSPSSTVPAPDPWLRKKIFLPARPERCLLHIASIGFHELHVNGTKVGEHVLAPSVSNLKHRVRYVTYDVTEVLRPGENVVGLWLGTSWSIFPFYRTEDRPEQPLVKVQGSLLMHDGTSSDIVSDAGWKVAPSANTLVGTWKVHDFGGERYDARLEVPAWAATELDDANWHPAATFSFERMLSVDTSAGNVLAHPIMPTAVTQMPGGAFRVDMGINYAGWFEIECEAEPGTEVHLQFSENESEVCTYAQRSAYVMGPSGKGTFRNRFNYMSGRWVTVDGLTKAPKLSGIRGWNVRSPFQRTSSFSCDQPLLNQIYETTLWTFENLALGNYIVDCPHRERTGYGDAEEVLRTSVNNYALESFLSQWAQDWRDVQSADGDIPHSAPTETGGGGPAWSAFSITLPWRVYRRYADERILSDGFATMQRWLSFLETHASEDMLVRWGGKWGFLGDWQWPKFGVERAQMERVGKSLGDTPETLFFNNCYWVHALKTTADIADALGKTQLAATYRARAERIRSKLHARFFNANDHSYVNGFPAYLAIALRAEVPPPDLREAVWKRLETEIMVNRGGHIWAGIIGGVVLVDLLLDHRRDDLLYAMVSKTDFPSWGEMLRSGHTTFTEGWGGTGSGLHSSFLYIGSWFIEGLAGIRQTGVGFQRFAIDPCIDLRGGPKQVSAAVESEYGRVGSSWQRNGESVALDVDVPPNTACRLRLRGCVPQTLSESGRAFAGVREDGGASVVELQPGSYRFMFRITQR